MSIFYTPLIIPIPCQLARACMLSFLACYWCSFLVLQFVIQIMSLPTIQNLTHTRLHDYHLIFAVILILKHATFLRLSDMSAQSALTHAEVDYREANIDCRIQQYLDASSPEHSDELFVDFIMATDMTCTHIGVSGDGGR
ncbi:hypothetical protein EDB85DRAFT_1625226 [Lactarius pseudohatsudake]|nr:hypothetical protein EDB85DRAFT_1625226 [Lactarius pseudohatsudake]